MVPHFFVSPIERVKPQWVNVALVVRKGRDVTMPAGLSLRRVECEHIDLLPDELPDGIRVVIGVASPDEMPALAEFRSSHRGLNMWVHPLSDHGAVAEASGKEGIPIVFSDMDVALLGTDLGLDLLSYYLFEPRLSVPVEPFHSLLRAELGEDRTLWNIWFGRAEEHFYVGADGRVSLCSSWVEQDQWVYGLDSSGPETWTESPAHQRLRQMLSGRTLPERCRTCPARKRCQGVIAALSGGDDCGQWTEILMRVHLAARSLKSRRLREGDTDSPS